MYFSMMTQKPMKTFLRTERNGEREKNKKECVTNFLSAPPTTTVATDESFRVASMQSTRGITVVKIPLSNLID